MPTALAMFPGDFQSIRCFAERDHSNRRPVGNRSATENVVQLF